MYLPYELASQTDNRVSGWYVTHRYAWRIKFERGEIISLDLRSDFWSTIFSFTFQMSN